MRTRTSLIIAAGTLLAATPALAQNEGTNATEANATAPAGNVVDMNVSADTMAVPVDANATMTTETTTTETTAPAAPPSEKRGFPWGVLGLLGLLGLIPRLRRG